MVIKINFGSEDSVATDEFIVDSGAEYNSDRGYGWVTQDSLDSESPTPIEISANTRDRSEDNDSVADSLIHLQYPTDLISPIAEASNKTPSAWEYDIANGSYLVTVGVGDPDFIDSSHVVNVEGQSAISNFVPTENSLFAENTISVEVTDGKLTVDAINGENTKLTFIEITPEGSSNTDNGDALVDSDDTENGDSNNGDGESDTPVDEGDTSTDNDNGDTEGDTSVDEGDSDNGDTDNDDDDNGNSNNGDGESDTPVDEGDTSTDNGGDSNNGDTDNGNTNNDDTESDTPVDSDDADNGDRDNDDADTPVDSDDAENGDTENDDTENDNNNNGDRRDNDDADAPVDSDDTENGDTENDNTNNGDRDNDDADTPVDSDDAENGDSDKGDNADTPVDSGDTENGENENIIKVNFGSATVSPPEGYIQDIGGEYNTERGYGWITQDSVSSDSPTPINISPNTRDRNSVQEDTFDSLIHLQYEDAFDNQNSVETPAAWEYELANGEYTVTVSVGDPEFSDSNHVINIEGDSVISGFVPTQEQLFTTQTVNVEVTDGKLTVDAIGGENTKLNFIEIAPADGSEIADSPVEVTPIETPTDAPIPVEGGGVVEMVQPREGGININFGVAAVDSPSGFIQDIGAAYNSDRGYGWVTQDSAGSENATPIDVFANARDRNTSFNDGQGNFFQEPVKDSLIHLQYPTGLENSANAVTTSVAWEYDLADGQYEVTVGVGDPDFFDSNHVINVEGNSIISGFVPTGSEVNGFLPLGAEAFSVGTATVEVNDGKLTIDALGGENTKINYVSIVPVEDI